MAMLHMVGMGDVGVTNTRKPLEAVTAPLFFAAQLLTLPVDGLVQYFCGFGDTAAAIALYNDPQSRIVLREGETPSAEMQAYIEAMGREKSSYDKSISCADRAGVPVGIALMGGGMLLANKSKWLQYLLLAMGASVLFVSSRPYSTFGRPSGGF